MNLQDLNTSPPKISRRKKLDILCVSDMCADLILRGGQVRPRFGQIEQWVDSYQLELGGSANIFACQYARLGGSIGILGTAGADLLGDFVIEKLKKCGVDTSLVRKTKVLTTGLSVALVDANDRAVLTCAGTINGVEPGDLQLSLLKKCKHWHISSYYLLSQLKQQWLPWLQECKRCHLTISLDCNWDPEERWQDIQDILPHVDLFMPNEQEALAISQTSSVSDAGKTLSLAGPMIVMKLGSEGVCVFRNGTEKHFPITQPIHPSKVVDSVGAGDNFNAGFIYAWLRKSPLQHCIKEGMACASASIQSAGGIGGQIQRRHS